MNRHTIMYINGKPVGAGNWKLKSVQNCCQKRGIKLVSAYAIVTNCDYAFSRNLDLSTGIYTDGRTTDHVGKEGVI